MTAAASETFVARAALWQVLLLGFAALLMLVVFSFLSAVLIYLAIDSGSVLLFVALGAVSLLLLAVVVYVFLALTALTGRVEVGPSRLRLRVSRWRGPIPLPAFDRADLPYDAIAAVETREEFYSVFGVPSRQTAYSILTKDGRRIVLGFTNVYAISNSPYAEAAQRIAARAGLTVTDRGGVETGGLIKAAQGATPEWGGGAVSVERRSVLKGRAGIAMQIALTLIVLTALLRACVDSQ